jgi:hypothetical protein
LRLGVQSQPGQQNETLWRERMGRRKDGGKEGERNREKDRKRGRKEEREGVRKEGRKFQVLYLSL